MRFKILPICTLVISSILSLLALNYLYIGGGYVQAPTFWLFYLIWSLAVAGAISFLISKKFFVTWRKLASGLTQFFMILLLFILFISLMPRAFITVVGDGYYERLVFRPISHAVKSPFLSVTVLQYDIPSKRNNLVQTVDFWGFIGSIKIPDERIYYSDAKSDPTTLEYALVEGDQADFTNKFIAMLDSRFDADSRSGLKPLGIRRGDIAENIRVLLPEQKFYDALDLMIAFGELDLLDKISGYNSTEQKWSIGALFIDLNESQLYRYYRLAKDYGKVRLIDDRNYSFVYGTDYLAWAVKEHDAELVADLVSSYRQPAPIYLLVAMEKIITSETNTQENEDYIKIVETILAVTPFENFQGKVSGEKRIDFSSRTQIDVGMAIKLNGVDLSKLYNQYLADLQTQRPEVYAFFVEKGYQLVGAKTTESDN